MCLLNHSHMRITDKWIDQPGWLHWVYLWHVSSQVKPYRTFPLSCCKMRQSKVPARPLRPHILRRVFFMRAKTDETLKRAQARYKKHFHMSVRNFMIFCFGDYFHVVWQPTRETASERMADESRPKLLPKAVRPFQIIHTTSHTITIDEERIANIISIDRTTLAPDRWTDPPLNSGHLTPKVTTLLRSSSRYETHDATHQRPKLQGIRHTARNDTYDQDPMPHTTLIRVLQIISSATSTQKDRLRYIASWYGYNAADETSELSNNIPEHFIRCYWNCSKCKRQIMRPSR